MRAVFGNIPVVGFTTSSDGSGIPPFTGIFPCYRLPPRALPPKNGLPSTVKKVLSHLSPSDGITVRFMFNRLPANKYRQLTVDTANRVPPTLDTAQNAPAVVCCTGAARHVADVLLYSVFSGPKVPLVSFRENFVCVCGLADRERRAPATTRTPHHDQRGERKYKRCGQ